MIHLTESQKKLKTKIESMFDVDDMALETRRTNHVDARMFFCVDLHRNRQMSLTEVSRVFGRTVAAMAHYVNRFDEIMSYDMFMRDLWKELNSGYVYGTSKDLEDRVKQLDSVNDIIESIKDKSKVDEIIEKFKNIVYGYNAQVNNL